MLVEMSQKELNVVILALERQKVNYGKLAGASVVQSPKLRARYNQYSEDAGRLAFRLAGKGE